MKMIVTLIELQGNSAKSEKLFKSVKENDF